MTKNEIVYLVGLPGCGKEDYIRENLPDHVILSGKDVRELVAGYLSNPFKEISEENVSDFVDPASLYNMRMAKFNIAVLAEKDIVVSDPNLFRRERTNRFPTPEEYSKRAVVFNWDRENFLRFFLKEEPNANVEMMETVFKQMETVDKEAEGFVSVDYVTVNK